MALNRLGLGLIFTAKDLASQNIQKVDRAFKSLQGNVKAGTKSIGPNFKLIGAGLAGVAAGAAGLAVVDAAVDSFVGFQKAMFEVGTLTEATDEQIAKLSDTTLRLSSEFGLDNQEAAKTFYQIISAGTTDAKEATALFETANRLAIAGVTTSTVAVDVLTSVMGAYGLTAADAEGISDTLFTTMKLGKTTIGELGSSMGQIVPFAAQLGVSFDEVGAAVSSLAGIAGTTSEVTTGLTAVLGAFLKPTAEGSKIAEKFGFKLNAATVRAKGFRGVLELLANVAEKDEDALGKLLGRKEALRVLLPLIGSRAQAFTDNLAAMGDKAGTTRKGFDRMAQSLDFSLKKLDALRKNTLTLIGEGLAPLFAIIANSAGAFFKAFQAMSKPMQRFVSIGLLVASVLGVVGGAFLIFLGFLPSIIAGVSALTAAVGTFIATTTLPLLPIIAIVGALGATIVGMTILVKKNIFGLGDLFDKVFGKVSLAFKTLVQVFTKGEISGAVLDELLLIENKGVLRFVGLVVSTFARIKAFFKGMVAGITIAFSGFFPIFKAVGEIISSLVGAGESLLGVFGVSLPTTVGGSISTFEKVGKVVGFLVSFVFQPMLVIISLISKAIAFVTKNFQAFADKAGSAINKVSRLIRSVPIIGEVLAGAAPQATSPTGDLSQPDSPGVVAAQGAAGEQKAQTAALAQVASRAGGSKQPIQINSKTEINLDSEQIAEVLETKRMEANVTGLGTPVPQGG